MPDSADPVESLVGFVRVLRTSGFTVGTSDTLGYCETVAALDMTDLMDVYWSGRAALVRRHEQVPDYNRIFSEYWLGEVAETEEAVQYQVAQKEESQATIQVPNAEPDAGNEREQNEEVSLGLAASSVATMRHRSFGDCTDEEMEAIRRIVRTLDVVPPRRRTRRTKPADRGRHADLRRTAREAIRSHGDPAMLYWRRRKFKHRKLILLLDVSGSMADHSRALLQFAWSARRSSAPVEAFCFGTRITRITRALEHRRPAEALSKAAKDVVDWEGGTRIGACVDYFVRTWARAGLTRGAVVVICSDGLDRGDPAVLAHALERLSRLSHRIVWMNPHVMTEDAPPSSLGMAIAAEYVDRILPGRDLASLERFADVLPELR